MDFDEIVKGVWKMTRYFPVLRWKQGEQQALKHIEPTLKENITPIIEFPLLGEPRFSKKKGETKETAQAKQEKHFTKKLLEFAKKLEVCWGRNEVLVDFYSILNQTKVTTDFDSLNQLFTNKAVNITPLINLTYANDALVKHLDVLLQLYDIRNIGFRVDLNTKLSSIKIMEKVCQKIKLDIARSTMVFDLRDISTHSKTQYSRNFNSLCTDFSLKYDRIVLLSGALTIPQNFPPNSSSSISRIDWLYWLDMHSKTKFNKINFGDYTISSADFIDVPFPGAPKIKYTIVNNWQVYKGIKPRSSADANAIQFQKMAESISKLKEWKDLQCYGDKELLNCANKIKENGGPTKWVGIGTSRHIAVVMSQLNANHLLP